MPVRKNKGHKKSFQQVHQWISERNGKKQTWINNSTESSLPHLVYHIDIADLIKDNSFKSAYPVSWRYIAKNEKNKTAVFEIRMHHASNNHYFNSEQTGPAVTSHKRLLAKLFKFVNKKEQDYDHAFLRIVNIKTNAIWMRSIDGTDDLFIPIEPCFHGLQAEEIYSEKQILNAIREYAKLYKKRILPNKFLGG